MKWMGRPTTCLPDGAAPATARGKRSLLWGTGAALAETGGDTGDRPAPA